MYPRYMKWGELYERIHLAIPANRHSAITYRCFLVSGDHICPLSGIYTGKVEADPAVIADYAY